MRVFRTDRPKWITRALAIVLSLLFTAASMVSQDATDYTFRSTSELVLVNVTVRDRNGNPVRDLKREDFTVLEDNKPQQVISFDLENTDAVLSTAETEAPLLAAPAPKNTRPLRKRSLHGH